MTDPTCAQPAALFERLKLETRSWHYQIEHDLDLLRPDLTRAEYVNLLIRFYGFYQPWETIIERRVRHTMPALLERSHKASLLRDDLHSLGLTGEHVRNAALCPDLPALHSQSEILGSFYVIEGATLGGQVLERHLKPKLHLDQGGCRFLAGYRGDTGKMWKDFQNLVESYSRMNDYDGIVTSALDTFASMHRWLCQPI